MDALNAHDLSGAFALYDPHAEHLGQPRPVTGVDAMRAVDAEFFEAFPDHHREVEQVVAVDDAVAAYFVMTGTHTGPLQGLAPTGRRIRFGFSNFIELENGMIRSMRQIYDSAAIASQLTR